MWTSSRRANSCIWASFTGHAKVQMKQMEMSFVLQVIWSLTKAMGILKCEPIVMQKEKWEDHQSDYK